MRKLLLSSIVVAGALSCSAQLPHGFSATYKPAGTYSADGKCIDSKNGIESIKLHVASPDKSVGFLAVTMDFGYSLTETITLQYKGMADNSYVYTYGGITVVVTSSKKMVAILPAELKGQSWRFYNANP